MGWESILQQVVGWILYGLSLILQFFVVRIQ